MYAFVHLVSHESRKMSMRTKIKVLSEGWVGDMKESRRVKEEKEPVEERRLGRRIQEGNPQKQCTYNSPIMKLITFYTSFKT